MSKCPCTYVDERCAAAEKCSAYEINHSAILSASGGIEFEDGSMAAPGLRIATINHDMNERHAIYTYGKVTVKKNAWIGPFRF